MRSEVYTVGGCYLLCIHTKFSIYTVGYVLFLCDNYMDVVEDAIESCQPFLKQFISTLKLSTQPIDLSLRDAAELLIGKIGLSQRGFKNMRNILAKNNIIVPDYKHVRAYCNDLNVGLIHKIHGEDNLCSCMGVSTNLQDTLQNIVCTPDLFSRFKFQTKPEQQELSKFLKENDNDLYQKFDVTKRTIMLRDTGDNFRASAHYPTEQTSYSILNMLDLVNNPYGQFVSTLWRGKENRESLIVHVSSHYNELSSAVRDGISLLVDDQIEFFNVIVIFVADLSFVKEVIGQCQCTSIYGCYHCKMHIDNWSKPTRQKQLEPKSIKEMVKNGDAAKKVLGDSPDHGTTAFKKFQQSHNGQWVRIKNF